MWATPGVSLFHAGCLCAAVSVLSVESRPHCRGLQRSFRVLSDQREGAERHWTTPFEHRADRGSDSAFQMADITRRILARGSTSTPVCETADCFLFHSFSLSPPSRLLPPSAPASVSFLKFQTENTAFHTEVDCLANPRFLPVFYHLYLLNFHPPAGIFTFFHPFFLLTQYFSSVTLTKLSCSLLPFQEKSSLHMVMIILHFLIFALLEHRPLFNPPPFLVLH